jgi:hypothetical protein
MVWLLAPVVLRCVPGGQFVQLLLEMPAVRLKKRPTAQEVQLVAA